MYRKSFLAKVNFTNTSISILRNIKYNYTSTVAPCWQGQGNTSCVFLCE